MKPAYSFILMILICGATILACRKPDPPKPKPVELTDAIITGVDFRRCACCGGLMITFSNDPKPYSADFFDIRQMPYSTGISESSAFPINVRVKYTKATEQCGNAVNISILERR